MKHISWIYSAIMACLITIALSVNLFVMFVADKNPVMSIIIVFAVVLAIDMIMFMSFELEALR